jgi:hypothetical protein
MKKHDENNNEGLSLKQMILIAIFLIAIAIAYYGREIKYRQKYPVVSVEEIKNNYKSGTLVIVTKLRNGTKIERASSFLYENENYGIIIDSTKIEILKQ